MQIMKLIVFSILLIPQLSFAATFYTPGQCVTKTRFQMQSRKGETSKGEFWLDFSKRNRLPEFSLYLPNDYQPQKVSLQFPSLEIIGRQGQRIFRDRFHNELTGFQNQSIEFFPIEAGVYKAPSPGVRKSQILTALLVSQYSFYLYDEQGQFLANAELNGSDLSLRSMVHNCFKEEIADYLEGQTRQKDVGLSWEMAYGLFDFEGEADNINDYVDFIPEIKAPSLLEIEGSYNRVNKLVNLLIKRQETLSELTQVKNSETIQATLEESGRHLERYWLSYSKLANTFKEGGWLQENRNLRQSYRDKEAGLISTESQLALDATPINDAYTAELSRYNSYVEELQTYGSRLLAVDNEIARTLKSTQFIKEVVTNDLNRINAIIETSEASSVSLTDPSIEEIESLHKELIYTESEQKRLKTRVFYLNHIINEMANIDAIQDEVLLSFNNLSDKSHQLSQKEEQLTDAQIAYLQIKDDWNGLSEGIIAAGLESFWGQQPTVLSADELKKVLLGFVKESYKAYDSAVESLELPVMNSALCRSASFRKGSLGLCVTPFDAVNERKVQEYIDSIAVDEFNQLIKASTGSINPFAPGNNSESLAQLFLNETNNDSFQEIQRLWNNVVLFRWMYFGLRNMGEQQAIAKVDFEKLVTDHNTQLTSLAGIIDDLSNAISMDSEAYETALADYRKTEQGYFDNFQKVRTRVLNLFSLDNLEPDSTGLLCLINETHFVSCFEDIDGERQEMVSLKESTEANLTQLYFLLKGSSSVKLSQLLDRKLSLTQERAPLLGNVLRSLKSYDSYVSGQIRQDLFQQQQKIEAEILATQLGIENTRYEIDKTFYREVSLLTEGKFHASQIDAFYTQIESLKPTILTHCQQEKTIVNEIGQIDGLITNIVEGEPQVSEDYLSRFCLIW